MGGRLQRQGQWQRRGGQGPPPWLLLLLLRRLELVLLLLLLLVLLLLVLPQREPPAVHACVEPGGWAAAGGRVGGRLWALAAWHRPGLLPWERAS